MSFTFHIKAFVLLIMGFILFTVIGTLSHEYGHILVAESLGYETQLHYGSMNYNPSGYSSDPNVIASKQLRHKYTGLSFREWSQIDLDQYRIYRQEIRDRFYSEKNNDSLFITIGGPIQTMLTGVIGLFNLIYRRRWKAMQAWKLWDWLGVFLALFWLRQVSNPTLAIFRELIAPNGVWFGGDEAKISHQLSLPNGSVAIPLAVIGLGISCYVIFCFIPKSLRFTFIIAGLVGGISGFVGWMHILGPVILP
ncbi:hypothetical protein [Nonlabens xiamenensis]|uniref:hypothetical protein n=1 Tax=Nonlabens xiamenensis TaxID=2341043 RepID=UPI000F604721|nr:hypothetical protein [Nonlabens xiamenensis]